MKDYRTAEEKRICERCDDILCSRHCVIVRREQERQEAELVRELGELERQYTLCDKSAENIARGQRIREIKHELGLDKGKPRQATRPAKVVNR